MNPTVEAYVMTFPANHIHTYQPFYEMNSHDLQYALAAHDEDIGENAREEAI